MNNTKRKATTFVAAFLFGGTGQICLQFLSKGKKLEVSLGQALASNSPLDYCILIFKSGATASQK